MTITFDVLEVLTYILIASVAAFLLSGSVFVAFFFMLASSALILWLQMLMAGVV